MRPKEETQSMNRAYEAAFRLAAALTELGKDERLQVLRAAAALAEQAVQDMAWQPTWRAEGHDYDP